MKGLRYQLKSVLKDKFCMMSFLLPVIVAVALTFAGSIDLSSLGELHFGVLEGDVSVQTITWLEQYGPVTAYPTPEELTDAVNEPSTNIIGVEADGDSIKTILSGDELDVFRQTADTLPSLYEQRKEARQVKVQVLERADMMGGFQDMFMAATLIVAMFMGCTFNAVNIVSEKEDGVAFINEILPMTYSQYIMQKIMVGFLCGGLSSIITVCICFRLSLQNTALMLVLTALSAFVAALIGLFIGRFSEGIMVSVVYLKVVMLLFMAVPIICFLVGSGHWLLSAVCYIVPSQAAFEGIMSLSGGSPAAAVKDILILMTHCVAWFLLFVVLSVRRKGNT